MKIPEIKLMTKLSSGMKTAWLFYQANKPSFLTGFAMGGAVGISVSSAKAGVKSKEKIDELGDVDSLVKLKAVAPYWIEPMVILLMVEIMIFGANKENAKRLAALASAYSLSESTLKEYKEKAEEIVGKKKAGDIQQAVDQEMVNRYPVPEDKIVNTGNGQSRFRIAETGIEFYSDRMKIDSAILDLEEERLEYRDSKSVFFITKNDVYRKLGLPEVELGDESGWCSMGNDKVALTFDPVYEGRDIVSVIHFRGDSQTFDDNYEDTWTVYKG